MKIMGIICLMSLCCFSLTSCRQPPKPYSITTISPSQKYKVRLDEKVVTKNYLSFGYEVYLSVLKEDKQIVDGLQLSRSHEFDRRLAEKYHYNSWEADNVVRLSDRELEPISECDTVLVHNNANKTISFLQISGKGYEMFLIFDLQPGYKVKLYITPQTRRGEDHSWIGATGRFDDGSITSGGNSFRSKTGYSSPIHYCMTIIEGLIHIESQELEGSTIEIKGAKINTANANASPTLSKDTIPGSRKASIPKNVSCQPD
ncbi:MAG: hypothetical protein MN733_24005 [Nitrososphaera sp.]|nr:hypothetical protein [Nitrososphaera sp.]